MSIRSSITGTDWTQVGTGPATVQLISVAAPVALVCAADAPSGTPDGVVLTNQGDAILLSLTQPIWAQVVNAASTAVVAVQPQ